MRGFLEFSKVSGGRWAVSLDEVVTITPHKHIPAHSFISFKTGAGLASELVAHTYEEILSAINGEGVSDDEEAHS